MADKFKVGDLVQFIPRTGSPNVLKIYARRNIAPMAVAFIVRCDGDGVPIARFIAPISDPLGPHEGIPSNCAFIDDSDFVLLKAAEDEWQ